MNNISSLEVGDDGLRIFADDGESIYDIGQYSTEEKAIKVLDMIQEAYARCEIAKASLSETAKMVRKAPETEAIIEFAAKRIVEDMTFQMPDDSEVEG